MNKINQTSIPVIEETSPNIEDEKPHTNRKKMRKVPEERKPFTFNGIATY